MERVIKRRSHGFNRKFKKAFHDNLSGERAGKSGVLPEASSAQANRVLAKLAPSTGVNSL